MNYEDLSRQTKSLLHSIPTELAQTERNITSSISLIQLQDTEKLFHQLNSTLHQIASNCDRLSNLLYTVEPVSQRSHLRLSLDQMRHECKHYQASIHVAERKRAERERQLREREELLAWDITPNASLRNKPDAEVVKLDSDLMYHSRLSAVGRRLDELLSSGSESLAALREQGMTLKGAHRRLLDVLNSLGLSNTVMRLIERRTHQDKVLFWLLVAVTLILMWLVWRYLH